MEEASKTPGRIEVDPVRRRVLDKDGRAVVLGVRAVQLLLALVERRDRVVSKEELLALVWPDTEVDGNNLAVQIGHLRKQLGHDAIATAQGRGYRFVAPVGLPVEPADPATTPAGEQAPVAALIGRAAELDALLAALRSRRLVSVVGPGGAGKTLLVQHAVQQCSGGRAVVWIEWPEADDVAARGDALSRALGRPGSLNVAAFVGVVGALAGRGPLLVVIDGAESAPTVAAELADALLARSGLSVLVTSQRPLGVAGEQVQRLEGLAVPEQPLPAAQSRQFGAVALFIARACARGSAIVWDDAQVALVAELCRRLDGLPLAIVLAARRCGQLGMHGLLRCLDNDRYRLLAGSIVGAPPRQQSLLATLRRSHALLAADCRSLLNALAPLGPELALQRTLPLLPAAGTDLWGTLNTLDELVNHGFMERRPAGELHVPENVRRFVLDGWAGQRDGGGGATPGFGAASQPQCRVPALVNPVASGAGPAAGTVLWH